MAIRASLRGPNLFSSLPSIPPPNDPASHSSPPPPPIPIPKYPPKTLKSQSQKPPTNPAFNTVHRRTKYFKPVREGVISSDGDRAVTVGESGVSYHLPGAPFEFQFSYSETPKVKPLAIREPAFLPFAPPTMPRPWTGKAPLKKSKKKTPLFDSFLPPPPGQALVKEMPGEFPFGKYAKNQKSREEILGEPLKKWEIQMFLKQRRGNRQVNLGRDGLTHNMLELIHSHWRRQSVCKVRCKGVPTVDMKNICRHLEEKTGGKIILRVGGVVYLYRGRNYDHRTRPQYPVMLWKPATPVYPKLIQEAPEGLTKSEADELRKKGKKLLPICKLAKNGVYITLVKDVRHAFEASPIVKIDCKGMHATDYKKLGAKLKDLVPCVLLSFDDEQILIWRGRDWKSMYRTPLIPRPREVAGGNKVPKTVRSSPKMMSLWQRAIDSSKAFVLDKTDIGPDELLKKVEEFESMSQTAEHSYPAVVLASEDHAYEFEDVPPNQGYAEDDSYYRYSEGDDDGYYDSDSDEEEITSSAPLGSLPIDRLAERLIHEKNEKNRRFDQ